MIIILAAAVILTISKNNPVESAKEATFKEDLRAFKDDLALTISKEYTSKQGQRDEKITTSDYNEIKEKIPSFTEKYKDKFKILNDELVFTGNDDNEIKWCEELNISLDISFDAAKWDKKASDDACFVWDGTVIVGYNEEPLNGITTLRIPSKCTAIKSDSATAWDEYRNFVGGITKVEIPETVTEIGDYAFAYFDKLEEVNIPDIVTSIGIYAFSDCSGLTNITIGNSVTSIGDSAFSGCSGLTNITIGNSVTSIGIYAFSDCSGLTNITIPNSVVSIGFEAFSGCSGLTEINVLSGNINYSSKDGILFNKDKTILIKCPSGNKLNNYSIPNSVTSIGRSAFSGCSGLTNITIGNSVTSIADYAFYGCSGLTGSLTIPNSVTSIGWRAFEGCSGLTTNIDFRGTKNEWNNISKSYGWNSFSSIKTITCTDGVITL